MPIFLFNEIILRNYTMLSIEPIPFKIPSVDSLGLKEADGLLKLDDQHIRLELKEKDTILGIYESEVKEYALALTDIHSITFNKKFFKVVLSIQANSMKQVEHIPGMVQGKVKINIPKKYLQHVKKLHSAVRLEISEHRLRSMGD